jgi:DNA replication protein DnaC
MTTPEPESACPACGRPRAMEAIQAFAIGVQHLPVECPCEAPRREAEARQARLARQEARVRELVGQSGIGPRHRDTSFDTFEVTPLSAPIVEICRDFVATFPDGGRGLTLAGPPGTGRTHLGVAITRALVEREFTAHILNVPALLRTGREHLRQARERFDALLDLLARCDHVLLDDLGREQPTAWTRETLYLVVNARYEACRATSVVTNLDLDALAAHAGAALVDRLAETNAAYWCEWPSYRRRRA